MKNNIITRTIWGGLFVGIIMGSLFVGSYATGIVLGLFMVLCLIEFHKLLKNEKNVSNNLIINLVGGIAIYLLSFLFLQDFISSQKLFLSGIILAFLPLLNLVISKAKNPLFDTALQFFIWISISVSFSLMNAIYSVNIGDHYQWEFLLGLFILVWANDTFAFLFGIGFGKHKLIPRISPKKSWEGAIGGFFSTILFSLLFSFVVGGDYTFWIFASIIISPLSIFGDLIESKIKRIVDIKDTGSIIPGHGGILDRFDAALYVAPFFYVLLLIFFS